MNNNPIALTPLWTRDQFSHRVSQIAQQFQQDKVQSVGLWFDDAAQFSCVLLACFQQNVTVLLPPLVSL